MSQNKNRCKSRQPITTICPKILFRHFSLAQPSSNFWWNFYSNLFSTCPRIFANIFVCWLCVLFGKSLRIYILDFGVDNYSVFSGEVFGATGLSFSMLLLDYELGLVGWKFHPSKIKPIKKKCTLNFHVQHDRKTITIGAQKFN